MPRARRARFRIGRSAWVSLLITFLFVGWVKRGRGWSPPYTTPKSERGRRTIILDDTLVALLLRLRSRYERIIAGVPDGVGDVGVIVKIPDDWLIFHAPDGDMNAPRHPDAITKQFCQRARKVLGFSIRLHDLRVSHGTWLLDQGTPVHIVARRLGHDAHVLLKIYAKRTQKGDESAAEKVGLMTKGLGI